MERSRIDIAILLADRRYSVYSIGRKDIYIDRINRFSITKMTPLRFLAYMFRYTEEKPEADDTEYAQFKEDSIPD